MSAIKSIVSQIQHPQILKSMLCFRCLTLLASRSNARKRISSILWRRKGVQKMCPVTWKIFHYAMVSCIQGYNVLFKRNPRKRRKTEKRQCLALSILYHEIGAKASEISHNLKCFEELSIIT